MKKKRRRNSGHALVAFGRSGKHHPDVQTASTFRDQPILGLVLHFACGHDRFALADGDEAARTGEKLMVVVSQLTERPCRAIRPQHLDRSVARKYYFTAPKQR